jgi:hypothetical protein
MATSLLSLLPAQNLEILLMTNPSATSFFIGGATYTRAQVLAAFNVVADSSNNNVKMVGLNGIQNPSSPQQVLLNSKVA